MLRKCVLLAIAIAAVLALVGCSGDPDPIGDSSSSGGGDPSSSSDGSEPSSSSVGDDPSSSSGGDEPSSSSVGDDPSSSSGEEHPPSYNELPTDLFSFPGIVYPVEMYYGADLGKFPPAARNFIKNTQFTEERMNRPARLNHTISVWWSEDNNSVLMSATYTLAPGYSVTVDGVTYKAGDTVTWGTNARHSGSSGIFDKYGEYAKFKTLRFKYVYSLYVQHLIENDPAYNEIIAFAKKLSDEFEYDWSNSSGYTGATPVKTPGKTYALCGGYANAVMEKVLSLNSVVAVQRWTSPAPPGHAWNVLELIDGRLLYFDLMWFDNENINEETGEIYQKDDYDWENITFYKELFDYSGVGAGSRVFHHTVGELKSEVRKSQ
jgi:hypothetical protein